MDTIEVQRMTRDYYEQVYVEKLDYLDSMDKFLETYNLPN